MGMTTWTVFMTLLSLVIVIVRGRGVVMPMRLMRILRRRRKGHEEELRRRRRRE